MGKRTVLKVPGVGHRGPLPMGVKIGNMIFSSGIMGHDPANNELPKDIDQEIKFAFQNMQTLVEVGGGSLDDLGFINILVRDKSIREKINSEWVAMFPDPNNRPARHVLQTEMSGDMNIQFQIIAVL